MWCGVNLEAILGFLNVLGPEFDGGVLHALTRARDQNNALLVELPRHAAPVAQVAATLVHHVANLTHGAVAVVGQGLDQNGGAAGTVTFVNHLVEDRGIHTFTYRTPNSVFDVIRRNGVGFGGGDSVL